jgi:hypothetical protein
MKVLGESEDRVLYKTILFDDMVEKTKISKEMETDGWEDLENGKGALRVVFRKYIESE